MARKLTTDDPGYDPGPLGVTREEIASQPGLMIDLATALYARRLAICQGLMALLGNNHAAKVHSLWMTCQQYVRDLNRLPAGYGIGDLVPPARELAYAISRLEDSIFGLINAKLKRRAVAAARPSLFGE